MLMVTRQLKIRLLRTRLLKIEPPSDRYCIEKQNAGGLTAAGIIKQGEVMNEELYLKLVTERKKTANILAPKTPGFDNGKKQFFIANSHLRGFAQNIIDHIDDHSHLKKAKILLLVKTAISDAKKLDAGEKITAGKASKANPQTKLLSSIGGVKSSQVDFIVWISGDYLDRVDATTEGGAEITTNEEGIRKVIALIDHEFSHCSVKIAGEFIKPDILEAFVQDLGIRHIQTCEDITNEKGRVLVRYQYLDKTGSLQFKMKKHDIEEFHGVIERHGAWDTKLTQMVDVLIENHATLFDTCSA